MTTATPPPQPPTQPERRRALRDRFLLAPVTATALAGVAATGLAAVVAGSAAASGAVVGTAMTVFFFASGAIVVNVVAKAAPALSLLVALLTYTLEAAWCSWR
jgi:ATP synthase protein I